jgi:hypothetical protein
LNRAIAIHAVDVMKLADGKVSTIATDSNGPAELVPPVAVKASMQVASKGEKAPSTPPAPKKK